MIRAQSSRVGVWLLAGLVWACDEDSKEPSGTSSKDASVNEAADGGGDESVVRESDAPATSANDSGQSSNQFADAGEITLTGILSEGLDAQASSETGVDASFSDGGKTSIETDASAASVGETTAACGAASQMCCQPSTCDEGLSCLGSACSCVRDVAHGVIIRNDGRVLWHTGSTQTPILNSETFQSLTDVVSASTSNRHGCAVTSDGIVRCWAAYGGANGQEGVLANGELGTEEIGQWLAAPVMAEVDVQLTSAVQVSSYAFAEGPSYPAGSCAVTGSGQVWCWGASTLLQGDAYDGFAHSIAINAEGDPTNSALYVTVGASHACYLNANGEVYCWGANSYGSVGVGSETAVTYPTRAGALTGVTKLQASDNVTCALVGAGDDSGKVFCWGLNTNGQLGIGEPAANSDCGTYCKRVPTRVSISAGEYLTDVIDIAVGKRAACAITSDEKVYCWGIVSGPLAVPLTETQRTVGQEVVTIDGNVAMGPNGALWDFANYSNDSWVRLVLKDGRFLGTRDNAGVAGVNCGSLD